jgi:hypothetical protein
MLVASRDSISTLQCGDELGMQLQHINCMKVMQLCCCEARHQLIAPDSPDLT